MAPYDGEYSSHFSINKIVQSEQVRNLLKRTKIHSGDVETSGAGTLLKVAKDTIERRDWAPNNIFVIDGSSQEVSVDNGFPGAAIGYLNIAGVLIDRKLIREIDEQRPVDPVQMRKTQQSVSNAFALPGANTLLAEMPTVMDSFRQTIYEVFKDTTPIDPVESLLDTYEALLAHRENLNRSKCPYEDCIGTMKGSPYVNGCTLCSCSLKRELYTTDALRVHERITGSGSSTEALGELRQVLEQLYLMNFIRTLEKKDMLYVLDDTAFVMDGPLAVFSGPAWLSQAIHAELIRINALLIEKNLKSVGILMLGIEKSGQFMEHFERLDTSDSAFHRS